MAAPDVILTPKNTMPRIDRIWAYLSVDPADGNEGVCAATLQSGALPPLIAADGERLVSDGGLAELSDARDAAIKDAGK